MSDLYGVLGVERGADIVQIKAAFRTLAKACHPDLHAGDGCAEHRFKAINLAYETLSRPEARTRYDEACAQRRAVARRRFGAAAMTMCVSFVTTVGVSSLMALWLTGQRLF